MSGQTASVGNARRSYAASRTGQDFFNNIYKDLSAQVKSKIPTEAMAVTSMAALPKTPGSQHLVSQPANALINPSGTAVSNASFATDTALSGAQRASTPADYTDKYSSPIRDKFIGMLGVGPKETYLTKGLTSHPMGSSNPIFSPAKHLGVMSDILHGKNIGESITQGIFGSKQKDPWEAAGMSWAEWNEKNRPTLEKLGIDASEWQDFKNYQKQYVGTPGVSRGEENPLLIENFWKWKAGKDQSENIRKQYAAAKAEMPGREATILTGKTTLLG